LYKKIKLLFSYYGESVIAFVQEFQRNSLLTNVNLYFNNCLDSVLEIMTNLLPLFTNINSIGIDSKNSCRDVLDQLQCEYSELAIPMLTSARILFAKLFAVSTGKLNNYDFFILIISYNCRDTWFCDWLHLPREDGKSRVLFLCGFKHQGRSASHSHSHFISHVKKVCTINFALPNGDQ
jgi:hypothetical protein